MEGSVVRKLAHLVVLLALFSLLCGSVIAGDDWDGSPRYSLVSDARDPLRIVKLERKLPTGDGIRPPMPVPIDPTLVLSRDSVTGPVITGDGDLSTGLGSAMLTPRGAAMSSPRQIADREIRKLIRRLG